MYHDATDEPHRNEEEERLEPLPKSMNHHGGFGSESLKECIELLNATISNSPATLHSGVGHPKATVPSHNPACVQYGQMKGSLSVSA